MAVSSSIFRTTETSNRIKTIWSKDPLSEFKKEAFVLFESLLVKIKNDVIKLLLNLNIVVSSEEDKKIKSEKKIILISKKLAETINAPVVQGESSSFVMEIFN